MSHILCLVLVNYLAISSSESRLFDELDSLSGAGGYTKTEHNEQTQEKQSSVQTHKFLMPGVAPQHVRNLFIILEWQNREKYGFTKP